jgi:hypothetical protein
MDAKPFKLELREAALKIYVELVARNVQITPERVAMGTSAENLARLAFKLSEAFEQVQESLNAENVEATRKRESFTIGVSDLAAWNKS